MQKTNKQYLLLINMKKSSLATSGNINSDYDPNRLKLKGCPIAQSMCIAVQSRHKDNLMMFSCDYYPFLNEENPTIQLLKTVVNLPMTTDRLQKIIRLSHPNIIGVRRIMRGSPRQVYPGCKPQTYYSFYYEMVHYDLKTLVQNPSDNPLLLNSILTLDLQQILNSVITYLQDVGVHYKPKLQNIGVTLNGNIKVYISPSIVFQSKQDKQISTAIKDIGQWWKSSKIMFHQKYNTTNQYHIDQSYLKKQNIDSTKRNSNIKQKQNVENRNQNFPEKLQSHNHLQIRQLPKVGTIQMQKIRKIDQQIKMIRERLHRSVNKNLVQHKVSPEHQRETQISPPDKKITTEQHIKDQVQRLAQSVQKYLVREPIQQNIKCINIYNHNIAPINPRLETTQKKNIGTKKNYIKDDFELYRNDEDCSLDTYDIQFQLNCDTPNDREQNRYRNNAFVPVVDRDQYSEYGSPKRNQGIDNNNIKNTKNVNQVSNKHCTESAGPKQFQNLVSRIQKSQLPQKKINIDEDPEQYLSQKEQQTYDKQNNDQSKVKINHQNDLKQRFKKIDEQNYKNNPKTTTNNQKNQKEQIHTNRRHSTLNNTRKSQIHDLDIQIQTKVKLAVTKTKHVLDRFKQVKHNRLSPKKLSVSKEKQ